VIINYHEPIGGYFGLELQQGVTCFHDTPHALKSGRSSLQYILQWLKPSNVYIPYYTCDGLIESFEAAGCNYTFYEINENLEPVALPALKTDEYFLYINYFDLRGKMTERLSDKYGDKFIGDCTQAFFRKGNGRSWFFNSARKFFGVPDGSFIYLPEGMNIPVADMINEDYITDHLLKRFNGHAREGYNAFFYNEVLCGSGIAQMSKLSRYLLSNIPFDEVIERRRRNFAYLHQALGHMNRLNTSYDAAGVPMCYPLLLEHPYDRSLLHAKDIFVPTFWHEVLNRDTHGFAIEKMLCVNLLPLPVDHRYSTNDMQRIIDNLKV
jgi:hypothetical protein